MNPARVCMPFMMVALILVASCGGGGGTSISGPILDLSEVKALVLDQFYVNGGMEDEYRSKGEFSVYVRDSATGRDVACTSQDDGMSSLTAPGVYYGDLDVRFREVEGNDVGSLARFKLVFVEKDGGDCPDPIGPEDDIAGESAELTSEELVGAMIWATNGRAAAVLRAQSDDPMSVGSMAPSLADGLFIDKLFFEYDAGDDDTPRFYIFVESEDGGQCQVANDLMDAIRAGDVLYAALGFPISCFDPADPDFPYIEIRIGLYVQDDSGPKLVAETDFIAIGDLIGERAEFEGGKGYISFQGVRMEQFGAPVVRLADLTAMQIESLRHTEGTDTVGALELHVTDEASGQLLACAGADQGLAGVDAAGSYAGLAATPVAAGWEREIFGYGRVLLSLVERSDGLACPTLPAFELPVLAKTAELGPTELAAGEAGFLDGAGELSFVRATDN